MTLFWIGFAVFMAGMLSRHAIKWYMYSRYNKLDGSTEKRRQELNDKYRPWVYAALGVEIVGLVIEIVFLCVS